MELSTVCSDDDIVCIADELLARWEVRQAADPAPVEVAEDLEPFCLPCELAELASADD